ncbi:putative arabinogalactan endo-beta-1,4-galactanase A [Cytospora mali]|uniref:Arabinogalactan endo-beta-1,4-galactanase n=1 Tax=Cytospora mali TaxID=578113 RepID=A0A194VVN7_CYTMA|nr:putative arabinogalactan endo-beta-1,4-galactanase A [Valsa mali]
MKSLAACFTTLTTLAAVAVGQAEPPSQTFFYKGHDLSSLGTMEASDNIYIDTSRGNTTRPADDILADGGMNGVRLRLWVDPEGGTNGLDYTLSLAKRVQAGGHRLYLDFHFADSWADPSKQPTPASWPTPDQGLEALASTLRAYVRDTLVSFSRAGVTLDIVSLGNEIRHGMLWPLGYVDVDTQPHAALVRNFSNLAALYSAARAGLDDAFDVHDHASHAGGGGGGGSGGSGSVFPQPPLAMIHNRRRRAWFGALEASGVGRSAWDVFGFSFYPFYGTSATLAGLRASLGALAGEYGKPVHVVETDYPAVCDGEYGPVPESSEPEIPYSAEWVREVARVVREVPGGLGRGGWYWEPAWLNSTSLGSDCNDAILFEAGYSNWPETIGYSRPSVDIYLDD